MLNDTYKCFIKVLNQFRDIHSSKDFIDNK